MNRQRALTEREGRRAPRVLVALVMALGMLAGGLAAAAPANAAPDGPEVVIPDLCLAGQPAPGETWDCGPIIPVGCDVWPCPPDPYPEGCPICDWGIDFEFHTLPAKLQEAVNGSVLQGTRMLGEAELAGQEKAAAYREEALDAYTEAAERLGEARLELDRVGWVNPETGEFHPSPQPNLVRPSPQPSLEAAGTHLAEGLTLLQEGLAENGETGQYEQPAMKHFDAAYAALTGQ